MAIEQTTETMSLPALKQYNVTATITKQLSTLQELLHFGPTTNIQLISNFFLSCSAGKLGVGEYGSKLHVYYSVNIIILD